MTGREFHKPVMAGEVLIFLCLAPGMTVVDATVGGGGHAALMLNAITPGGLLIGIDRDDDALAESEERLKPFEGSFRLVKGRMSEVSGILDSLGIARAGAILADLGISGFQVDEPSRGFSFLRDGPLDMRMDRQESLSALGLIEKLDEERLAEIIREYGEERYASKIAKKIFLLRGRIKTTTELADVIAGAAAGGCRMKIHPATRTFQAIRIAVNDELNELGKFLAVAPKRLETGGRIAVISYHSLEDRMVKRAFRAAALRGPQGAAENGGFKILTKKVVRSSDEEIKLNTRARSAKLRAMQKI